MKRYVKLSHISVLGVLTFVQVVLGSFAESNTPSQKVMSKKINTFGKRKKVNKETPSSSNTMKRHKGTGLSLSRLKLAIRKGLLADVVNIIDMYQKQGFSNRFYKLLSHELRLAIKDDVNSFGVYTEAQINNLQGLHVAINEMRDQRCFSTNRLEIIGLLIQHKADVNTVCETRCNSWEKPLNYAVRYGYLKIAELLIEHGAEVNSREALHAPILDAICFGHVEMIKLLIEKGAQCIDGVNGKWDDQLKLALDKTPYPFFEQGDYYTNRKLDKIFEWDMMLTKERFNNQCLQYAILMRDVALRNEIFKNDPLQNDLLENELSKNKALMDEMLKSEKELDGVSQSLDCLKYHFKPELKRCDRLKIIIPILVVTNIIPLSVWWRIIDELPKHIKTDVESIFKVELASSMYDAYFYLLDIHSRDFIYQLREFWIPENVAKIVWGFHDCVYTKASLFEEVKEKFSCFVSSYMPNR